MKRKVMAVMLCLMLVLSLTNPVGFASGDYEDYIPGEKPLNLIKDPTNLNGFTGINGAGGTLYRGDGNSWDSQKKLGYYEKSHSPDNWFCTGPTLLGSSYLNGGIEKDKTYVVSVYLANGAPDKKETLKAAICYSTGCTPVGFDVTSSDVMNYKARFVAEKNSDSISFGFDSTLNRSGVTDEDRGLLVYDYSFGADSFYVAEETVYDIALTSDADTVVLGDTITLSANVVNQIGSIMDGVGEFTYYAVDKDRTTPADGFDIVVSPDTYTAEVTVTDNVAPGEYVLIAQDELCNISGFRKGVVIDVKRGEIKDTLPGEDPFYDITIDVESGETTLGTLEDITLSAELVDSAGSMGTNPQDFTWYVLDEARLSEITQGITLETDGSKVTISFDRDATEGVYYAVAEAEGLRKSQKITFDKSGDKALALEILAEGSQDKIADKLSDIAAILSVADYVSEADVTDLTALVVADHDDVALWDETSAKEYVERCALVSLFNISSDNVQLWNAEGDPNYEEALALADIDAGSVTLYGVAMSEMSSEGKLALWEAVSGKAFNSYDTFVSALCDELLVKTIQYPAKKGTAYLSELFTEANLDLVGIEADAYLAISNPKQFLATEIREKTFTKETLAQALLGAYESDYAVLNADYVPAQRPGNIITGGTNLNCLCTINGAASTLKRDRDSEKILGYLEKTHSPDSWFGAGTTYIYGSYVSEGLVKGNKYVVSLKLRNAAPEKKATLKAAIAYGTNNPPVAFDVKDDEFKEYTATFVAQNDASSVSLGLDSTVDRSSVTDETRGLLEYDYSDGGIYLARESVYDLGVTMAETTIEAGTEGTINAAVLNQVGDEYTSVAPSFEYYAVTEDRSADVSGISFAPAADTKSATITIAKDVEPGVYVLIAEETSFGIDGFKKGIEITVTKPVIRDTLPGTDPLYDISISTNGGNTTMGVFDKLNLSAGIVDSNGTPSTASHSFSWYVLNQQRTDKVTESFELTISQDTKTAELTPKVELKEGVYYIVAESEGLRKSVELTIDKKDDIKRVIYNISAMTAEEFEPYVATSVKLLEIEGDYAAKADTASVAKVIIGGRADETLTDKASLADYFARASIVALYNKPVQDVATSDEKGGFLYGEELGLADIDKAPVTLYRSSMEVMSTEGKKALQSALTGKDFDSYKAFMTKLKEELLLKAIRYPAKDGYGYLEKILTEANLALFGIDAEEYFDLEDSSEFDINELVKKSFTIRTLSQTLEDAYETDSGSSGSSGSSGGGGGGGSFSGGTISFGADVADKDAASGQNVAAKDFDDVPKTHWAYTDIQYLKSIGVINGISETSFAPNDILTREQFVKLLMEAFQLSGTASQTSFEDVDKGAWYAPYVGGALSLGIVNGKSEKEFGVGDAVTRQDVCVMIDRALGLSGDVYEKASFKDADKISDYAEKAVSVLYGYGVINGTGDGSFAPQDICTRAQAAKIISSTLSVYNSLNLK